MAGKPSLQFYPGDWWRANDVKGSSMSTQGVWFNLLMAMWDEPIQGKIRDTKEGICRIIGATIDELEEFFEDNKSHKISNVTFRNKKVTIINRRMYRSYIERESTKLRVQTHRNRMKRKCNEKVTPYSSTSSSLKEKEYKEKEIFDKAREKYPGTKRGLDTEFNYFCKHRDWKKVLSLLSPAIKQQEIVRADNRAAGRFNPPWKNFKTWIYNRCWEQTVGVTESPEEKAAKEQQALEKKRQEIRDEHTSYYQERTTEDLQVMLKNKILISHWWLIKEILKVRK